MLRLLQEPAANASMIALDLLNSMLVAGHQRPRVLLKRRRYIAPMTDRMLGWGSTGVINIACWSLHCRRGSGVSCQCLETIL